MIYKIGDIAKVMGVTTEAIRHYERMGLIKPERIRRPITDTLPRSS